MLIFAYLFFIFSVHKVCKEERDCENYGFESRMVWVLFSKKICERCGKEYRFRTISENKGHYLCRECIRHCSKCGKKIPLTNVLGQTFTVLNFNPIQKAYEQQTPVGSGLCNKCFYEEQELLKQAQLRQAQEVIETPSVWTCEYCQTVNRGNFCFNCGASRKKVNQNRRVVMR